MTAHSDCHEVWSRAVPRRTGKALVLATMPALQALCDAVRQARLEPSMLPEGDIDRHASALRLVEDADLVLIDMLAPRHDHLLLVGYGHARGKTIIAYGASVSSDSLLRDFAAAVPEDMGELDGVLAALRQDGPPL